MNPRKLLLGAGLCVVGFLALAVFVYGSDRFARLDDRVADWLQAPAGSHLESLAHFLSNAANPAPLAVLLLALIFVGAYWRRYREVVAAAAVVLGANVTTQLIKLAFSHPRVQAALGADHLVPIAFPSGHSTAAASAAWAAVMVVPPERRPLAALLGGLYALAVAVGVVVAGWHYISDVVGAWLVVGGWGLTALAALNYPDGGHPAEGRPIRRPAPPPAR